MSFIAGDLSAEISHDKINNKTDMLTLGDVISVNNSVATLNNGIFIFSAEQEDTDFYYINGFKVEKSITFSGVSPRSIALQKNMRVIFPYRYEKAKVTPISENELKHKYPNAYQYLLTHKKELEKRSLPKNINWYEFGRRQALEIIFRPKLIISNIITKRIHVHFVPENIVPYAGLCITLKNMSRCQKKSMNRLEKIKSILLKEEFFRFLMSNGTPTAGRSLRISVRDIQLYPLRDEFSI